MDWHSHRYLQVIHVLSGETRIDWGEGWRSLGPHDVHVLPPSFSHRLHTPHRHTQFGLNFTVEDDQRGVARALKDRFAGPTVTTVVFRDAWVSGLREGGAAGAREALRLLHLLEEYSLALLESVGRRPSEDAAHRLLAVVTAHATGPLLVDDVAGELHMSRAAVQRLCQRQFGGGVAHLHERVRLERAARGLLTTGISITECAADAGYEDLASFSRAFKRRYGLSPRSWRAENRRRQA